MAKNLASVKPVKCRRWVYNGKIAPEEGFGKIHTPLRRVDCTTTTTARYKKLMDVVNAALTLNNLGACNPEFSSSKTMDDHEKANRAFQNAIEAAEKAGVLKNI